MLDSALRQILLLIQPIGLVWLVSIVLAIRLWRGRRRPAITLACVALLITICGSTDVPGWLLRGYERPWAGVKTNDLPACDAVIVLGGGAEPARFEMNGVHLSKAGDRVMMGIELIRLGKAPVLVLGGSVAEIDGKDHNEADAVKAWLDAWKFPPAAEILSLGGNAHTRQEAEKVAVLRDARGWKRVLLVTSANHMRRSLATFRTLGIDAVPAPCNFLTTISTSEPPLGLKVPTYAGFEKIGIWAHETAGWWHYRWRGWIAPAKAP